MTDDQTPQQEGAFADLSRYVEERLTQGATTGQVESELGQQVVWEPDTIREFVGVVRERLIEDGKLSPEGRSVQTAHPHADEAVNVLEDIFLAGKQYLSKAKQPVWGIVQHLLDPRGYSARMAFFLSWLTIVSTTTLVGFLALMSADNPASELGKIIANAGSFALVWLFIPTIRRCHDLGWSGWRSLLVLVPPVGGVVFLLLLFSKGVNWVTEEAAVARCIGCGQVLQPAWEHCTACGRSITGAEWMEPAAGPNVS